MATELFQEYCKSGNLLQAKLLFESNPGLNVSANAEYAFRWTCGSGHLELAKWLLEINPDINISAYDECAFRWACEKGYIDIAKWLLAINPDINISAYDECAFRWACNFGHINIVNWFQILKPDKYIVVIENNKIVSFCVKKLLNISKTVKLSCESITDCNICMDTKADILTDCKHQFCETCILHWMKDNYTCPYCRGKLKMVNLAKVKELAK